MGPCAPGVFVFERSFSAFWYDEEDGGWEILTVRAGLATCMISGAVMWSKEWCGR